MVKTTIPRCDYQAFLFFATSAFGATSEWGRRRAGATARINLPDTVARFAGRRRALAMLRERPPLTRAAERT